MNTQKELQEYLKKKDEIIADMRACISYTPDRDNDLLCLMERYIKAEKEERPGLLDQTRRCMDGETYENPFVAYYCFSTDDIDRFNQILSSFLNQINVLCCKPSGLKLLVRKVVIQLNNINASCRNELVDPYRREKLMALFEEVGRLLKFESIKEIVNEHRTW